MGSSAKVLSIDDLKNFSYFYSKFRPGIEEAVRTTDKVFKQKLDLIGERKMFWFKEVDKYIKSIREAELMMAGIMAANVYVPITTKLSIPGYAVLLKSIQENRKKLNHAYENYETACYWYAQANESYSDFLTKCRHLVSEAEEIIPKGDAFLAKIIKELDNYTL